MSEQKELVGQVQIPSERVHNFDTLKLLCDFVMTFGVVNFNVRTGDIEGKTIFQLIYQPMNN